jgi:hypothetical protein
MVRALEADAERVAERRSHGQRRARITREVRVRHGLDVLQIEGVRQVDIVAVRKLLVGRRAEQANPLRRQLHLARKVDI